MDSMDSELSYSGTHQGGVVPTEGWWEHPVSGMTTADIPVPVSGCREVPERKAARSCSSTQPHAPARSSTLLALLTTSRPPRPPSPPSPTPPNMPHHVSFLPLLATLIHAAAAFSPGALLSPALRGASHSAPSLRSSFLQHPAAAATPEWRRRGAERQGQVDLKTRNLKPDTAPRNDAVF